MDFSPALREGLTAVVPQDITHATFTEVRNSMSLAQCRNAHPTPFGAKPLRQITYPIANVAQAAAWPHMQVMRLGRTLLLLTDQELYEVNRDTLNAGRVSAGTDEPLYAPADNTTPVTPTANSNLWQGVGFQDSYFLTNGTSLIFRCTQNLNESDTVPKIVCANSATHGIGVQMLANHQGRLIVGGISGNILTDNAFEDLFDYWRDNSPYNVALSEDAAVSDSWIFYGPPGGGDTDLPFVVMLAVLELVITAKRTRYLSIARTWIEEGLMGFHPMMSDGTVKTGKQYGNDLIIGTEDHVERLTWTENGYQSTLLDTAGVAGRGAMCSDGKDTKILWVDTHGQRHYGVLNAGFDEPKFQRELSTLTLDDDLVVCYDEDYWWIGQGTDGFCQTPEGKLGRNDALVPSSLLRLPNDDKLYGTYVAKADDQDVIIETETFDGGAEMQRKIWEVSHVNLGTTDSNATGWSAQVKARHDKSDSFTTYNSRADDGRGRFRMKVPGVEFRVVLTNPNYKEADLDSLSVDLGRGKLSLRALHDA